MYLLAEPGTIGRNGLLSTSVAALEEATTRTYTMPSLALIVGAPSLSTARQIERFVVRLATAQQGTLTMLVPLLMFLVECKQGFLASLITDYGARAEDAMRIWAPAGSNHRAGSKFWEFSATGGEELVEVLPEWLGTGCEGEEKLRGPIAALDARLYDFLERTVPSLTEECSHSRMLGDDSGAPFMVCAPVVSQSALLVLHFILYCHRDVQRVKVQQMEEMWRRCASLFVVTGVKAAVKEIQSHMTESIDNIIGAKATFTDTVQAIASVLTATGHNVYVEPMVKFLVFRTSGCSWDNVLGSGGGMSDFLLKLKTLDQRLDENAGTSGVTAALVSRALRLDGREWQ